MAKYVCSCGKVVVRKATWLREASCFDCKQKRRRAYALGYKDGTYVADPTRAARIAENWRQRILANQKRKELAALSLEQMNKRRDAIIEMRISGKTLEQIAAVVSPTITRERVRQILKKLETVHGVHIPIPPRKYERFQTTCKYCGNPKYVQKRNYKGEGKHYHRQCFKSKYLHEDGTPMTKLEIARLRWRSDEERRRKHGVLMKRRYLEIMADPVLKKARMDKEKVYAKKWQAKKRQDPVWVEQQRVKARERYAAIKADPVLYAAQLAKDRARAARRRAKLSPP